MDNREIEKVADAGENDLGTFEFIFSLEAITADLTTTFEDDFQTRLARHSVLY